MGSTPSVHPSNKVQSCFWRQKGSRNAFEWAVVSIREKKISIALLQQLPAPYRYATPKKANEGGKKKRTFVRWENFILIIPPRRAMLCMNPPFPHLSLSLSLDSTVYGLWGCFGPPVFPKNAQLPCCPYVQIVRISDLPIIPCLLLQSPSNILSSLHLGPIRLSGGVCVCVTWISWPAK